MLRLLERERSEKRVLCEDVSTHRVSSLLRWESKQTRRFSNTDIFPLPCGEEGNGTGQICYPIT